MCKLFDNVTFFMFKVEFNTCDMQFGYKEGYSYSLCTLVCKKVISHYRNNGSCVYACLLDASKPDLVHLVNCSIYCVVVVVGLTPPSKNGGEIQQPFLRTPAKGIPHLIGIQAR